ncbi:endospore germination permease [Anoxybacteroides amylolyticum]|uniref:Spore germination family protein n=1 Tax=Anoxybacteroides amylolyticum TaxID=294699 RepID=A0A160F3G7_9BACL|nr:endospore germination permease [Anoxybacillus amylolyticus]ANB60877.1 spore germination family protein [Anoxybacillus amylolyticus]
MKAHPLNIVQIACILMLSIGLMNHVIVIPLLLEAAHRDAWIAAILTLGIMFFWLPLLHFIMKQSKQIPLFQWIQSEFSTIVAYLVAFLGTLLLITISYVTLKDTVTFTTTTYLTATPNWAISLTLSILCFYNAYLGIPSVAKTSVIILPFVVIFGVFVMFTTIPHKDYSLLKPILENGWDPVWKGMIYTGAGYAEILIILFMQHRLQPQFPFLGLLVLAFLAASLSIGPTIGAIIEFGPIKAAQLRYPAFEQWRLINLGTYIEHMDFLSIYQWLSGAFVRISLATALVPELFGITNEQSRRWVLIVLYLAILAASLVPISDNAFLHMLNKAVLPLSLFLILFLSFLLAILALISSIKARRE